MTPRESKTEVVVIRVSRGKQCCCGIKIHFGFVDGLEPLIKMLKNDSGDVREASAMALANLTANNSFNAGYVGAISLCWVLGTAPGVSSSYKTDGILKEANAVLAAPHKTDHRTRTLTSTQNQCSDHSFLRPFIYFSSILLLLYSLKTQNNSYGVMVCNDRACK